MLREKLLDIRAEAELNQEDMVEILKVSQSNYSRWGNWRELIPLSKLNILCNHFEINMDYVVGISRYSKSSKKYEFDNKKIGNRLNFSEKKKELHKLNLQNF